MGQYVKLVRPQQWVKNLFLFAPLFFTFEYSFVDLIQVTAGFILFSFAASALYAFNDILDKEEDQKHPEKKQRPVSSGQIGVRSASILSIILLVLSLGGAAFLSSEFLFILVVYVLMNIAYTIKLKHISILDISLISIGFVLRIFAGAELVDVAPTNWIVLVTFLLALFLALAKRRDDVLLVDEGLKTRKNVDGYNLEMINAGMVFMAGVTTVAYIMYTLSDDVTQRLESSNTYLTSFFVIVGILRYMQITFVENRSGNPASILINDLFLKLIILGWLSSFLIIHFWI